MQKSHLFAGALVAFCLIGMLALPASAAPATASVTPAKISTVDQGLKDDLWASHMQYRLARYDMNVEQANAVIGILGKYQIDTSSCQATLDSITAERADLQSALQSKDREKLKAVNGQLKTLWKQFLQEVKDAIKSHYGKGAAGTTAAGAVDSLGLGSA